MGTGAVFLVVKQLGTEEDYFPSNSKVKNALGLTSNPSYTLMAQYVLNHREKFVFNFLRFFFVVKGPAAEATDAPQL
jgi:hypothetical protein